MTVLVGTCDRYASLWENFLVCFNRYWKIPTNVIFVGETKEVPYFLGTPHRTILCGEGKSWGERMRAGIEECDDFVFFILDDYFLKFEYPQETMSKYLEDMNTYDIDRLQIAPSGHQHYLFKKEGCPYNQLSKNSAYLISMQPSIWRKSFLLSVLKPNYSPWDFEIAGTKYLSMKQHRIFADLDVPEVYFNAVRRGFQKSRGWEEFRKQEQLKDF